MPRKVPDSPAVHGELRTYIPDVVDGDWDNQKDPQPVTVTIRNPTEREKREAYGMARVVGSDRMDLNATWHDAIKRHVTKVVNYIDAKGEPITNGAELAEHGETAFVMDVGPEILGAYSLTEEERKNSERLSGSTQAATPPLAGTVTSAETKDAPKDGVVMVDVKSIPPMGSSIDAPEVG